MFLTNGASTTRWTASPRLRLGSARLRTACTFLAHGQVKDHLDTGVRVTTMETDHTLWVHAVDEIHELAAVRALREALTELGEVEDTLTTAREVFATLVGSGLALLAFSDELDDVVSAASIIAEKCEGAIVPIIDPEPDELAMLERTHDDPDDGYVLAMVLLAGTQGSPLRAFEIVANMKLNTGDPQWDAAIYALSDAFHWVEKTAKEYDVWPG